MPPGACGWEADGSGQSWQAARFPAPAGETHNLLLVLVAAAVGRGQRGGAGLAVPGHVAELRGAADGQRVDAVGVAVAVAAVVLPAPVPRGPDEDGAQPPAALWTAWSGVTGERAWGEAWQEEMQLETGKAGASFSGTPCPPPQRPWWVRSTGPSVCPRTDQQRLRAVTPGGGIMGDFNWLFLFFCPSSLLTF